MTNPFGIAIDEFEDMDAVEVEEAPQAAPKPAAKKVAAKPVSKPVESIQEPVAAFREEAPKQVQMSEIDRLIEAKAKGYQVGMQ